ncbi:hypothetical protein FHS10_000044 [Mucilaginibacter dorajii]|nr:hypothetical protein [Mucilaginibacter dorajii]
MIDEDELNTACFGSERLATTTAAPARDGQEYNV